MKPLGRLCALVVGAVFLWAAWGKIVDPPGFAQSIYHYGLVPEGLRHGLALILPWLEALCGLNLLVSALFARPAVGAARWTLLLLVVFTGALAINLWRGHPVDCGCFGVSAPKAPAELLREMRWALLRDGVMIALAWPLWRGRS